MPDYVICLECEGPVYVFEWNGSRVTEAVCPACGNDSPAMFATEGEYEEMSEMDRDRTGPPED
jgi:translation initiation factor 2 beta subunit (eIF-2beta)/eIF-5